MHLMKTAVVTLFALCAAVLSLACGGSPSADAGAADEGVAQDAGGADAATSDAGADGGGETYAKEAKLTRGPWLGNVTPTGVTIQWETDRAAAPAVTLGGAASGTRKGATAQHDYTIGIDSTKVTRFQHTVPVTGLTSAASVTFDIPDLKTPAAGSFVTAPGTPKPFRFVAYGDTRPSGPYLEDNPEHRTVAAAMAADKPDFYVHTGDMGFAGTMEGEWYTFFTTSAPIMPFAPIYPVFGNHEAGGEARWAALFALPGDGAANRYYSWDYANAHFAVLCIECGVDAGSPQIAWLSSDLAAAKANGAVAHIFVSFHEPVYTYSTHAPDATAQATVVPLLKQYGIRAVLCGHNHLYERIVMDGVTYLTLGGGGAPLYDEKSGTNPGVVTFAKEYHYAVVDVDATQATFTVKNDKGTAIDTFTLP